MNNKIVTSILLMLSTASLQAMECKEKLDANVSLKVRAADSLAAKLIAGSVNLKDAEKSWAPDLVELVKERLVYQNLLFFANLFRNLSEDIMPTFHKNQQHKALLSPNGRYALVTDISASHPQSFADLLQPWPTPVSLGGCEKYASKAAFSHDSTYLIIGFYGDKAQVWGVTQPEEPTVLNHTASVEHVAISPEGKYALTGSNVEGSVRLWNLANTPATYIILESNINHIAHIAFSKDGKLAAISMRGFTILWDIQDIPKRRERFAHAFEAVKSVSFSNDGRFLLVCNSEGDLCWWDSKTFETNIIARRITDPFRKAYAANLSIDGRHALAYCQGMVYLWDLDKLLYIEFQSNGLIDSAQFGHDGKSFYINLRGLTAIQHSLYDIPEKLSLEQIVLLIQARTNTHLAAQIRYVCALHYRSGVEKYKDEKFVTEMASLSPKIYGILRFHNFNESYEFKSGL